MCFGGGPKMPNIVYQGPSDEDIAKNEQALAEYQTRVQEQQATFTSQLQEQIDAANAETASLQERLDATAASAAAASAAQQTGAYVASSQVSEDVTGAQTTAAITKKKKPSSNLKIAKAGLPSAAGAGLNIGV
tara:strand:- start:6961 stop:7359 length:399 start_codon:yes stop_codon:yes gene_type:complete